MSSFTKPNGHTTGFKLPCYFKLKKELGEIDARAECIEIARREFSHVLTSEADLTSTLQGLSKKHQVRVDFVKLDELERRTSGLHLVVIRQAFETFENARSTLWCRNT